MDAPKTHNIRLPYLSRFSMSQDGRIFEGSKEYKWRLFENNIVVGLVPSNGKFPKNFTLQELYLKSWGTRPHMSIVNKIRKSSQARQKLPTTFFISDNDGTNAALPLQYALRIIQTTQDKLYEAVANKTKINGFEVRGF